MSIKTVAQKRGADVQNVANKLKSVRKSLAEKNIPDTVHWNQVATIYKTQDGKKNIQVDWDKFAIWMKENAQHFGKLSGVGMLWMSEYLMRGLNKLLVDNQLIENLEQIAQKKSVTKFGHKHPWVESYLIYYMFAASVLMSGTLLGMNTIKNNKDDKDGDKKENIYTPQDNKQQEISFENFVLNPNASDAEWDKQINAIQPYVIAHIFSSEGFIENAYYDNGNKKGTLTFGAGFTIKDEIHRNFASKILGRRVGNGSTISIEEAKILVDAWLREKVYPPIKQVFKKPLPSRLFISLAVASYNVGESCYSVPGNSGTPVVNAVNAGKSIEEIANVYVRAFGKKRGTNWGGMANKYGVCALYMMGKISDAAILNAVGEAPYSIEPYVRAAQKNDAQFDARKMDYGKLLIYDGVGSGARPVGVQKNYDVENMLLKQKGRVTKGTTQLPVREYMTAQEVKTILAGNLFQSAVADFMEEYQQPIIAQQTSSEKLNEEGEILFFTKNYDMAEKKFKQALQENDKNYIVYSNLSILYYHMGRYSDGLKVVQNLLNSDELQNVPKDIRSYTYYNAALCREELGDNAKTNKEKVEHYNKAKLNLKLSERFGRSEHDNLEQRIDQKIKDASVKQVTAFNDGIKQIRQKNAKHDLLLYGTEYSGNLT